MITQTTYNRLSATAFAIIIARLLSACQFTPHPDHPIMHYELDGKWCSPATPLQYCLEVFSQQNSGLPYDSYIWSITGSSCVETGKLTGGLEFTPDTASRLCVAPEPALYSASAQWHPAGLHIEIDQSPISCRSQPDSLCAHETLTLDLDYRP